MATICLDGQVLYNPPVAAIPKPMSCSFRARNGDHSAAAISRSPSLPPTPLRDTHNLPYDSTGLSQDNVVEISSDDDDLDDDRSDTSFPPVDEPRVSVREEAESGSDAGTDKGRQQEARSPECSPRPPSASHKAPHTKQAQPVLPGDTACEPGQAPAPEDTVCDTTVLETAGASRCGKTSNRDGTICLDNDEWDKRFPFSPQAMRRRLRARRANESACKATEPDQPVSVLDSHRRAQSPRSAASGRWGETQQTSHNRRLSQHHDHRGDSDQTSDPEHHDPPVPDNREQSEEGSVAPPQTQESRASIPRLSDDESTHERELANPKPSIQPSANQSCVNLQVGGRRHCDTDDGEDYRPIEDSDAEHSQDDDIVRSSRRKRRRISMSIPTTARTTSKQQTRLHYTSSRSQQTPTSTQHSRRRRSQRSNLNPLSPPGSTLEEETAKAPVAKFEEWPLGNAVLKRITLDGVSTFQLQFTWDPCAEHGTRHYGTDNRSSVSSAKRHRPVKQGSTRYVKDKDTTTNKPSSTSRRAKYTLEDDAKICRLKEQGLSWPAIAEHFPGRTPGAIEVRYHTKLKTTKPSRSGALQLFDYPQTLSVVDDAGEEEWEVEEICDDRKLDDGSVELLVKWKGGEETWEPYGNVAETEALDDYERLYGKLV